jgi:glycosyltransferase involved in cell wall biosynthesis
MSDSADLPFVSFVIPTYNAGKYLKLCLESIFSQEYLKKKIEVLIVDGGSKDDTLEISKRFPARILKNPKRLAEIGLAIGVKRSKGDFIAVLAADNVLPNQTWLRKMIKPFQENGNLAGAFPFPEVNPSDTSMNRYYCHIKTDPLTYFVFDSFGNRLKTYNPILVRDGYKIYVFPKENCPLIALAQGFIFKKRVTPNSIASDDVAPFCEMVLKGYRLALVHEVGIYHYHLENLRSFVRKYVFRAVARLDRAAERPGLMNGKRKIKMRLWLLYSLSWVWPCIDSIRGYKKEPDVAWVYHPLACFLFTMANGIVGFKDLRRTFRYIGA